MDLMRNNVILAEIEYQLSKRQLIFSKSGEVRQHRVKSVVIKRFVFGPFDHSLSTRDVITINHHQALSKPKLSWQFVPDYQCLLLGEWKCGHFLNPNCQDMGRLAAFRASPVLPLRTWSGKVWTRLVCKLHFSHKFQFVPSSILKVG